MIEISIGIITMSLGTIVSFIIWLLKRRKDFKKLFTGIKGVSVEKDKKMFKLKYQFYKKLVNLLLRSIKEKYLTKVFEGGNVNYEKMVKEIMDFIDSNGNEAEVGTNGDM